MSDTKNENLFPELEQENQEQPTRVMQPVEATARPPRRRRSDRYEQEEPAEQAPAEVAEEKEAEEPARESVGEDAAAPSGAPEGAEPSASRPLPMTRVIPAQDPASRPAAPRPNVLNRAERMAALEENLGSTTRRPMGTPPGFVPRKPISLEPRPAEDNEQPARSSSMSARIPTLQPTANPRRPASLDREEPAQKGKKLSARGILGVLVILVLVVGLVVVGALLLRQSGGEEKEQPTAVPASGFTVANDRGTAPLEVVFNLTTDKSVTQVRLVNEDGEPLNAMSMPLTEYSDNIIWMMSLQVNDGFEGLVLAQIYDGAAWLDTGMSQMLEIAAPATVDAGAFGDVTDAPTDVPTPVPTEIPTDVPTEEPAAEITDAPTDVPTEIPTDVPTPDPTGWITPTPTLAVSATPTMAMAGTPTPVPAEMALTQVPVSYEEPTAAPAEEPTPDAEPDATEEPEVTPTAVPTATPPLIGIAAEGASPSLIRETVIYNGNSKVDSFVRERTLNMPIAEKYLTQPYGVLTYRGSAFRQNAAVGTVGDISGMTLAWTAEAGSVKGSSSTYYGIGWTGQPAIIKWSKEVRAATNIFEEKRSTTALKEVIVAGLDGKIYFLDLADGQPTRNEINLGYPMRGTPSIHPLGYPIMTVGQYARKMAKGTGDIGLRFYNLLNQKQDYWIDGLDGKKNRPYNGVGAFDTSALIDPNSDTLVAIGTNGMLYTAVLNTEYNKTEETVSIKPSVVSMKSRTKGQAAKNTAVQASPAMYGTYVYYADMEGILRCVDTTTMTTVWAVDTDDAVEAAIALDMDENGDLWLYTANTLDTRSRGDCSIRRYNALTGEEDWVLAVNVAETKNKKTPGAMASPVIGQNGLSDLVYFTLSSVSAKGAAAITGAEDASAMAGVLLAMDKASGKIVWTYGLDAYSYSSPVAVYDEAGKGWIIQASSSGVITLLDGLTGSAVSTLTVEGTIDASPAVYNDTLVIGTTGKGTSFIYGIKLQ